MNVWLGVLCMNLAKEVKWIKTIHYMCNSSVIVLVIATRKKNCFFVHGSVGRY